MKAIVFDVFRELSDARKETVGLSYPHSFFDRFKGRELLNFPLRIVVRHIPLIKKIIPFHGDRIFIILIDRLLSRHGRQRLVENGVGKRKTIRFRGVWVQRHVKDHVDASLFQCRKKLPVGRNLYQFKPQAAASQCLFGQPHVIVDDPRHLARVGIHSTKAGIMIRPTDAHGTVFGEPRFFPVRKHGDPPRRHITLVELVGVKGVVILHFAHGAVKDYLQIRPPFVDHKIDV